MDARSLMRSAWLAVASIRPSPSRPARSSRAKEAKRIRRREDTMASRGSEWGNVQEKALQPTHGLDLVHDALAAELDAGIRHLGGRHRIAARDGARIDHAREADVFAAAIDGDLLLA